MNYRLLSIYVSLSAYLTLLLQALSVFRQITFWWVLIGSVLGVALVTRLFILIPATGSPRCALGAKPCRSAVS
jgi:Na+-transporting NADH:ubiquinone oxidoreductase subunit NqrB